MTTTRRHPFVCVFLLLWTQHIALNFVKNVINPISQSRIIKVIPLYVFDYVGT